MKMLPLKKPENKRTSTEKAIRNSVFMLVIVYVASLTWLFLNSQIDVVNAESDLTSVNLSANANLINTRLTSTGADDVIVEDTGAVDAEILEANLVEAD